MKNHQTTLITGASGGIGLELAKQFAQHGHNLVLVARSREKLQKAADDLSSQYNISCQMIAKDLLAPNAPQAIFAELKQTEINILVNNAGTGVYGAFLENNLDKELASMELNMTVLTKLTKLFLPAMIARGRGKILNVASTAAFQPGPFFAVYYASKAYVLSFTEAIAEELKGTGVSVTALCPGPTRTNYQKVSGISGSRLFQGSLPMQATEVARIGYAGLMAGKPVVIAGLTNKLLALLVRLGPRNLVTKISRWTLKKQK